MKHEVKVIINKSIFAIVFIVFFFLILYVLNKLFISFLLAGALAYVFSPLVNKLSEKIPHLLATWIVFFLIFLLFSLLLFLFVPLFTEQAISISKEVPKIWKTISIQGGKLQRWLMTHAPDLYSSLQEYETRLTEGIKPATKIVAFFATQIYAIFRRIIDLILFPFFLFYLLKDFEKIKRWIKGIIPGKYREEGGRLLHEIDRILYGFIFGQLLVAVILGILYALGLAIIGVPYSLLIGITAGIFDIIPYVGTVLGFILASAVTFFYFSSLKMVLLVLLVFAGIRVVEGNFISPRLIGGKVGLHPIFVVFAIILGGKFFGLFGMLVFVPIFAIGKVFFMDIISYYKNSELYKGAKADETAIGS